MSPRAIRDQAIAQRRAELLTVKEYADLVRQHVRTVRRKIRQGRQRGAINLGGEWRIDILQALDTHIAITVFHENGQPPALPVPRSAARSTRCSLLCSSASRTSAAH